MLSGRRLIIAVDQAQRGINKLGRLGMRGDPVEPVVA